MNFCMEHKREATGCYFIYIRILCAGYTWIRIYVNTFRDWAIAPSMLYAILQESSFYSEYYYIYIYTCMYMQTFFPRICGRFSSSWHANRTGRKERGRRKNIFWYEEQRRECHLPPPNTCRAAIFDNCQRQRNAPSHPSPPLV